MHEIGLYHPRIHFPSDAWVKAAALYWTKMERLVPDDGHITQDSDVVRALDEQLDFVVNFSPPEELKLDSPVHDFCSFVKRNGDELRRRYRVSLPDHPIHRLMQDGRSTSEAQSDLTVAPYTGVLAGTKVHVDLGATLLRYELARFVDSWFVMHPAIARVYMSVLADELAEQNYLRPVTDDSDAYAVGTGWNIARMENVLLADEPRVTRWNGDPLAIGMLAIQAVIPRNIEQIPVKKIIQLRREFGQQFNSFRNAVDAAASEITAQLQTVEDAVVLRAYLEQEVQERFLAPLKELRREMKRMRIDTATATLTFKYELPVLAGLTAGSVLSHEPLLAGGVAVAFGLLGLVRGMKERSRTFRDQSPVSYLMLLQHNLEPRSTLSWTARQIRRVNEETR